MHQPKKVKTSLSRAGFSIRFFSLSLLLMGSMLTFISVMASSSQVFAQGSPKMSTHNLTSVRPHTIITAKKSLLPKGSLVPSVTPTATPTGTATATDTPTATSTATATSTTTATPTGTATATSTTTATPTGTATATDTPTATSTATTTPTGTATATSTVTATPTSTATVTANKPLLFLTNSNTGGSAYHVGDSITFNLTVSNLPSALAEGQTITLNDAIPSGITNLSATANDWQINLTSTMGPALLTATYIGTYPVAPGAVLPTITLTGNLTPQAIPTFTTAATVSSTDDPNPSLNTSINTIFVSFASATVEPTASATVEPTASATVEPTASATTTATATVTPGGTPALAIVKVNLSGDHFKVGDKVTYVIVISNLSSGDPVVAPNTISVSDVLPLGLTDIKVDVDNSQWSYTSGDTNGPALLTVNYVGNYPVAAGQTLAPITITGKLTNDAVPYVTNTATVDTAGNSTVNNSATDTVFVDVNGNGHCCNNNGCCTDQNGNNGNGNNGNGNNGKDKNQGDHRHHGKGSRDPISGDPTSYNGSGNPISGDPTSGNPTSYNGSGDPAGSGALPHLPLTGGAPLAG